MSFFSLEALRELAEEYSQGKEVDRVMMQEVCEQFLVLADAELCARTEELPIPRKLAEGCLVWFQTIAESGLQAAYPDGERTPNAIAMDDLAAQFSNLLAAKRDAPQNSPHGENNVG